MRVSVLDLERVILKDLSSWARWDSSADSSEETQIARPKSRSFRLPPSARPRLSGLRSRCMTKHRGRAEPEWRNRKASESWTQSLSLFRAGSEALTSRRMRVDSSTSLRRIALETSESHHSRTAHGKPLKVPTPTTLFTLGCVSRAKRLTSRWKDANSTLSAASWGLRTFKAIFVSSTNAEYTSAWLPLPTSATLSPSLSHSNTGTSKSSFNR
mmetsp:Transcript_8375/g.27434  ORF Transcript_8375/g.27434 Transcript_8375/m.27434 type:complete len:213 (-) Transcript_8375:481-1119(-)